MEKFEKLNSIVCPLDIPNIDTDQIIPKQFLKRIERTGFGEFLFYDWRYISEGKLDPDFSLNKNEHQGAQILLTRDNFGCGSSREHAPWSLLDFGFHCIIAPSFADIFYNNCFQNGILPIILKSQEIDELFTLIRKTPQTNFSIDLTQQSISYEDQDTRHELHFDIASDKKEKLLKGLDDIGLTCQFDAEIKKFEKCF